MTKRKINKQKSKRPNNMTKNEWMDFRDWQAKKVARVEKQGRDKNETIKQDAEGRTR